jgi:hypothetical protein
MSDINIPSLVIAPEFMQEANETQSFNLAVPETNVKKGRNKNGETATWTEILQVGSTEIGVLPEGQNAAGDPTPERVFIDVKFHVAPETFEPKNVGRSVKQRYLLNPVALGTKGSKERTMTLMSIGRLNGLLRAAGFEIDAGTGTDLAEYFTPNADGQSQISGLKVAADFRNYIDNNGTPRQDIVAYDSAAGE